MIPKSVRHTDLLEALQPLLDLLGVSPQEMFPPLHIGLDEITFAIVPRADWGTVPDGYPTSLPTGGEEGSALEWAEWSVGLTVAVER